MSGDDFAGMMSPAFVSRGCRQCRKSARWQQALTEWRANGDVLRAAKAESVTRTPPAKTIDAAVFKLSITTISARLPGAIRPIL
jgi:hypothetical protein